MKIHQSSSLETDLNSQAGFSLVEVLIASLVLMIVLVGVFQSQLNSLRRMEKTGDMNQIQDSIRKDLAVARKAALKWQCKQDTACSGLAKDQDQPPRYDVSHCSAQFPLAEFPISSGPLISDNQNNQIMREVVINGQQIDITYLDTMQDEIIKTSTSIIPQAMSWCMKKIN